MGWVEVRDLEGPSGKKGLGWEFLGGGSESGTFSPTTVSPLCGGRRIPGAGAGGREGGHSTMASGWASRCCWNRRRIWRTNGGKLGAATDRRGRNGARLHTCA